MLISPDSSKRKFTWWWPVSFVWYGIFLINRVHSGFDRFSALDVNLVTILLNVGPVPPHYAAYQNKSGFLAVTYRAEYLLD
jgi:hypothetical protein